MINSTLGKVKFSILLITILIVLVSCANQSLNALTDTPEVIDSVPISSLDEITATPSPVASPSSVITPSPNPISTPLPTTPIPVPTPTLTPLPTPTEEPVLNISNEIYLFNTTFDSRRGSAATGYDIFITREGVAYLRHGGNGGLTRMLGDARSVHAAGFGGFSPERTTYFILTTSNDLYAWGQNDRGLVGDDTGLRRSEPVHILHDVANIYFTNIASEGPTVYALRMDGSRWTWGGGIFAPVQIDTFYNANQILHENHITMQLGNQEVHPLLDDLSQEVLQALGGTNNIVSSLTQIERDIWGTRTGQRWYALTQDGALWGWGDNNGRLGDGTRATRSMPVQIAENVRRITENYFITYDNNWYSYSGGGYIPVRWFQNVSYMMSISNITTNMGTWYSPDGQLLYTSTFGLFGPTSPRFGVIFDNIMLPSIQRVN